MKLSLDPAAEATAHPRTATIPFESERQYMASLNRFGDEGQVLVKGAVERVLPRCALSSMAAAPSPSTYSLGE